MPRPGVAKINAIGRATLALLLAAAAIVHAQNIPTLSNEARNAATLTDDQKKQIDAFVKHHTARLTEGSRGDVDAARDELIRNGEGSAAHKAAYSAALGPLLLPVFKNKDIYVRMAAGVVAASVGGGGMAEALAAGLSDEHLGVRYCCAKGIADALTRRAATDPVPFTDAQQQVILKGLKEQAARETSAVVSEQSGRALGALTIPAAFGEAVGALGSRLDWHRQHPESPPREVVAIVENLAGRLNAMEANKENIDNPLRDLTAAAGLYLRALGELLAANKPETPEGQQGWGELVEQIDAKVLDRAAKKLGGGANAPNLGADVRGGKLSEKLPGDIQAWVGKGSEPGVLTTSFRIPIEKLQLAPLPQAPAAPAPAPADKGGKSDKAENPK